jgi:hypothetical protein
MYGTEEQLDQLIPLAQAIRLIPSSRPGKRLHIKTLYRWISPGVRGVQLEVKKAGHAICTTRRWLQEFMDQLTALREAGPDAKPRTFDDDLAEAVLDKAGI